ncbi:MAG: serine hydrolase domain-containing protein [Candidatus Cryptobacteroides sp.]
MRRSTFKSIIAAAIVSSTASYAQGQSVSEGFEDALKGYEEEAKVEKIAISSLIVWQDGVKLCERYFAQKPEDAHVMWSVSKTFTSFAVGFAIEEGLLSLDTRIADIFPEEMEKVKTGNGDSLENMLQGTIRDYLTMSCGQKEDGITTLSKKYLITDVNKIERNLKRHNVTMLEAFFKIPFENKPGTVNCYNSIASYVLSAAVQKVTGQCVNDYLTERLWKPLSIEKPRWDKVFDINCGGWGLYLKTEDMAKVGLMMLDGGRYEGRQVLPESYLEEAIKPYFKWDRPSFTTPEEGRAYFQGYGFQIWHMNDGFSASGMQGQYIMVLPGMNAVIACTADIEDDQQKEQNLIFKHLVPALKRYETPMTFSSRPRE